jgi:ABC-type polar amino acid transport system ATPase subunit
MVFQRFNLFPHMTALENVTEGPIQVLKQKPAEAREAAMALLERVGLANKARAYPAELSGGQQQRAHFRPRSRAGRRSPERDASLGSFGNDNDCRDA